jgi:calcineurin-like phosphoesterase family protein
METWFTSDSHDNHVRILIYEEKNRPFKTLDEMNETLVANWNRVVSPDDTVWHLGDQAMQLGRIDPGTLVRRRNGHKKLVIGNHDQIRDRNKKMDWPRTQDFWLKAGFEEVYQDYVLDHEGHRLYLKHEPTAYPFWPKDCDMQLCGHVHSQWASLPAGSGTGKIINVGVDVSGLTPLTFQQLLVRDVK